MTDSSRGGAGVDREAETPHSSTKIRASFIQAAGPHLRSLSDADRLADEIRDIVIETIPPPSPLPRDGLEGFQHLTGPPEASADELPTIPPPSSVPRTVPTVPAVPRPGKRKP